MIYLRRPRPRLELLPPPPRDDRPKKSETELIRRLSNVLADLEAIRDDVEPLECRGAQVQLASALAHVAMTTSELAVHAAKKPKRG